MLTPGAAFFRDFKVHRMSQTGHFYGKTTGKGFSGPVSLVSGVLGNQQHGLNRVSQVDGVSDVTICQFCGGRAQQRNNGLCQHFSLGQSCPQLLPGCQTIQFFPA